MFASMVLDTLTDLISGAAGSPGGLTPSERRLADYVDRHPTALAFDTVASVAERVGVSGPTVIRFATKLGFDGYAALQEHAQSLVTGQLRRPSDRHRLVDTVDGSRWDQQWTIAASSIDHVFASVTPDDVTALATPIAATAGRVWITSSGTSSAAAHVLANGLSLLRPDVHHLTGSGATISAQSIDTSPTDVAIAIDMPRYERSIVNTARWFADLGATVVAITDGPLSPLAAIANVWIPIDVHAVGPFDSSLATVTLAELVLADVARQLDVAATERLDRAEALWALHQVFVDG